MAAVVVRDAIIPIISFSEIKFIQKFQNDEIDSSLCKKRNDKNNKRNKH